MAQTKQTRKLPPDVNPKSAARPLKKITATQLEYSMPSTSNPWAANTRRTFILFYSTSTRFCIISVFFKKGFPHYTFTGSPFEQQGRSIFFQ